MRNVSLDTTIAHKNLAICFAVYSEGTAVGVEEACKTLMSNVFDNSSSSTVSEVELMLIGTAIKLYKYDYLIYWCSYHCKSMDEQRDFH